MFKAIKNKIKQFTDLNSRDVFYELFKDKEFTDLIIRLNTEGEQTSQLIYGVNYEDKPLDDIGGEYSPYTVMLKKDKGQITDHVTLKDTGEFYRSFRVFWVNEGNGVIQITADTIKEGGVDLVESWGRQIIGLSEDNIQVLREYARNKIHSIIKQKQ